MYNEEEIEDSLEFLRGIEIYKRAEEEKQEKQKLPENPLDEPPISTERVEQYQWDLSRLDLENPPKRPTTESGSLKLVNNLFVLLVCILLGYFIASMVTYFVAYQTSVEGESMEPTLSDGDSVIIQKMSYYFKNPARFDIIVFPVKNPDSDKKENYYVKRVIGLPGETVQISGGIVYINGRKLTTDKYCLSEMLDPGRAINPISLKGDEYFVLGDNRNMSTDSRSDYVGLVKRDEIQGEVVFRIWPFEKMGLLSGE